MDNDELQTIDDSFELLPEEVKVFLYQGPYDKALTAISTDFSFSDKQRKVFSGTVLGYIAGTIDSDELMNGLDLLGLQPEQRDRLPKEIATRIITPLLEYVDSEIEVGTEEQQNPTAAPADNTDLLASLKSRLTTPTVIAPTSRGNTPTPQKSAPIQEKQKIDLYREQV